MSLSSFSSFTLINEVTLTPALLNQCCREWVKPHYSIQHSRAHWTTPLQLNISINALNVTQACMCVCVCVGSATACVSWVMKDSLLIQEGFWEIPLHPQPQASSEGQTIPAGWVRVCPELVLYANGLCMTVWVLMHFNLLIWVKMVCRGVIYRYR